MLVLTCPKCGGTMEEISGWSHNLVVKSGILSAKRPKLFVCQRCGYMEFYLKNNV